MISGNNIGVVVFALIIAVIWMARHGVDHEVDSIKEPDALEFQNFTPQQLQQYNGVQNEKVLMAISGKVYDVTTGKSHYGPGGAYSAFAGRDASRGLAKHSFDAGDLSPINGPIDDLKDLNDEERAALDHWQKFFEGKYPCCGKLVNA